MDQATTIAITTIIGSLHLQKRINDADVAKIVDMLETNAEPRPDYIAEPLRELAREIRKIVR